MGDFTVLVADDDKAIRTVLNQVLTRLGHDVRVCDNISTLWNWLVKGEGHLVISDVIMPDGSIFDVMPQIIKQRPNLPLIIMSARNTFMTAIKASEAGAYEYIPKPFDINELIAVINRVESEHKSQLTGQSDGMLPKDQTQNEHEEMPIIGRSAAMQEIYRALARLMQSDIPVMINGESGTGKELAARSLHDFGKRRTGPFVAVNMAAIPQDLIEAELFGHEKGAFTGAITRQQGRFEQANGGTLFLDEIGDMPLEAQTRLLRVLQEGEFTTVGGMRPIQTDVRIISATHQDINQLIRQGRFREDLYYRLNVVPIRMPALRERKEDIPDLVNFFSVQHEDEAGQKRIFDVAALEELRDRNWPGNVRELENFVRRVMALHQDELITHEIVLQELDANKVPAPFVGEYEISDNLELICEKYLSKHFASQAHGAPPGGLYPRILPQLERPLITHALLATQGNQLRAAELLGINRNTLRKKIRDFDIDLVKVPKIRTCQ